MPQFPRETTTTLVLICLITLYKTLKIILFVSQGGGGRLVLLKIQNTFLQLFVWPTHLHFIFKKINLIRQLSKNDF